MSQHSEHLRKQLVKHLSDHAIHSGSDLADRMAVTRTAIWKHIGYLRNCGLDIEPVKGRGYRLGQNVELFKPGQVRQRIAARQKNKLRRLQVVFETGSSNRLLLDRLDKQSIHGHAILAEYQTQGRGRRGRRWLSPMACGINLSVGWHYANPPPNTACLSLACGIAVMRVFRQLQIADAGLKWPNDIFARGRKLGGILVEMRGEQAGPMNIIVGIGINVCPSRLLARAGQPVTDITTLTGLQPSRNELAGLLINELLELLHAFPATGREQIINAWRRHDCAQGQQATIRLPDGNCTGKVMGIDDEGLLLMQVNRRVRRFTSGEISLVVQH
ncbi:MAG: biotin--[acetyl-CoA-carboxylase] ligase [Thiotrichales bacterium]|nr:biotin--[acetyl-CoA-carboxylase] ligase [Thiotrichales bacterium]